MYADMSFDSGPILAFLKFVVITVKFTCTIKLICFVCKEMVVHKFVKKVTSEFCMLIVLIDRGELGWDAVTIKFGIFYSDLADFDG